MMYLFMGLAALGAVALDQITKLLTVANIGLYETVPVIPGAFSLTYFQNDGAAWSSFRGMQWLFALIFLVLTVAIVWEFSKKRLKFTNFDRWCIVFVWAGGLGNMIDRLRQGFVIDMIKTEFMDFPVFNVADCFITCACVALVVHLVFFNKAFWKDEKKK